MRRLRCRGRLVPELLVVVLGPGLLSDGVVVSDGAVHRGIVKVVADVVVVIVFVRAGFATASNRIII